MAGMSLTKLNELLERALRSLHQEGLSVVTYQEPKPWLPESYWAQVAAEDARYQAENLIDLAKHAAYMKAERALSDRRRSEMSAADVMAEWDKDIPRLQGGDTRMRAAGWGRPMKHSGGTTKRPHKGNPQPAYNWQCYQCGRPITDSGKDHGGGRMCDRALMPQDMIDNDECCEWHTPKPWHGEEEDQDGEDDF